MKRRWKILTAILLSAAMMVGSMGTGFAAEPAASSATEEDVKETENVSGDNTDIKDDEKNTDEEEAVTSADTENAGEEPAADEDKTNAGSENSEDKEQDTGKTEVTENNVPAASDAPGETADDEISDNDIEDVVEGAIDDEQNSQTVLTVERKFIHEYDGKPFSPSYTVPSGYVLLSENRYATNATKIGTAGNTIRLATITDAGSKYFHLYPSTARDGDRSTEDITVTVEPRDVTYRSGTYTKQYDGKPLSQNSAEGAELPKLVKGSMVDGQTFKFNFDDKAVQITPGSTKNKFTVSSTETAKTGNYNTSYEYGNLIVTESRNNVNSLPAPEKPKAVVDNKGNIKVSWKKVKSYKSNGKKGGKTNYEVWRYREDGQWEFLGETKKTSYLDKTPGENERFIYKVIAKGIDASGIDGQGEIPAYVRATPKITTVSPYDGINYARVAFLGLGTDYDEYTLEHWNAKSKGVKDQITVNRYNSSQETYKGKSRSISLNCYLDAGGSSVSISGNNKATFNFRIMASETTVYDYGKTIKIPASGWSKPVKLKLISTAPILKGKRETDNSFILQWNKVKKANAYLLEYCQNKDFTGPDLKQIYCSPSKETTIYNNRKETVKGVKFGEPYYCRVTAYNKKKNDGSEYGTAIGTSAVIVQYGRQKAVKGLKAEYYEDGDYRSDARLSWTDDEEGVVGYIIQRWSYEYNKSTKEYDKLTSHAVLSENRRVTEKTQQTYANLAGGQIKNGELVKYRVQSIKLGGSGTGENRDGRVYSEPSDYYYMNPSEANFDKKKYTVNVGDTFTPKIKFKPKKLPKTADGLTKSEFEDVFYFNDKMEFKLESDSLTPSEIKKHVTVETSTGKLKGVSEYKKSYIKLKASSPNDPTNVFALATIMVGPGGSSDSDTEKTSSSLVVCIDAGHGGKDPGAEYNGIVEKDKNLEIAKMVAEELKDAGAKVYLTRSSDEYISLTDRTDYADKKGCNLFISIHCNAGNGSGTEVYYSVNSKYAKKSLAESISKAVSKELGTTNIGAKSRQGSDGDYYSVIRTSAAKGIPGLIVEHAFLSNSSDAAALKDESKLKKMAKAEAKAIIENWK